MPSTTTRLITGIAASALTLGLGTVAASAADEPSSHTTAVRSGVDRTPALHTGARLPADPAPAADDPTTPAAPDVTRIKASSAVLARKGANDISLALTGSFETQPGGATLQEASALLRVGGKNHPVPLLQDADGAYFVQTQSTWGVGPARVLTTTFNYSDGTTVTDPTASNKFYVRRLVKTTSRYGYYITVFNPSDKMRFEPRGWVVFKPATGTFVSLGTIRLQYKKGSSWKTLRVFKLDSRGNGSFTRRILRKHSYRLYVPTSPTLLGGTTPASAVL